ncbi:MAG: glutamate--tRNA ligase [Ferruginibacter sp.]
MDDVQLRVRFAPSPTGGLHLGGVRTVLYNYLFAKQQRGKFIVRIEDTDQRRFVKGAEEYIFECLDWCGLSADESVQNGGPHGPYRQSERKEIYRAYALKLVENGHAYYAFDTPEALEEMREKLKAKGSESLMYDHHVRSEMKNSLSLSPEETQSLLKENIPYVIRIKANPGNTIILNDVIRGEIKFDSGNVDDKVLLKADGMPTYHLAVVVDDYLMKITHAFRGEEWLPSAPVHVMLWQYLFGLDAMPAWAHLPLILKPDGHGKLSKRDGDRLGFPVYAMDWKDPFSGEITKGFKELGFLPEAFLNLLAVLGWNDGSEQEIFSLEELIKKFSLERVHHAGAKFDYEKARWFNHEWIKKLPAKDLLPRVKPFMDIPNVEDFTDDYILSAIGMVKDRCTLLTDFNQQLGFLFHSPEKIDVGAINPKWNEIKNTFFLEFCQAIEEENISGEKMEEIFKRFCSNKNIKPGEVLLPLRIMLVGGKYGPGVFDIAGMIGSIETRNRILHTLQLITHE